MTTFRCNLRKANGLFALAVCALGAPAVLAAEGIVVPSGQPVSFIEFISEEATNTVRFRFLTPEIGKSFQYTDVADDFQVVCDELVMPALVDASIEPAQIVLSMSAVNIPFGEDNPDVLQFFEIFRPENGTCIWEEF
ncbi:hypothetical protein SAMN05444287_1890 [Octadecabacter temperatus]|uniref:Uncharacterized protein n=1 Tax=Octadecabacter temperatus TaxID=1458307 RepID=A0A0K0Y7D3_9RHOB|nr:DUF6497 family protein [Octadecabacter temperatus]AKS46767.1 hypothetical protein OSB_22300 [Octadecabacter temperatus]SIO20838.1 hypothetical protein SAMN05444287_1890 [Octadecabacter temperatus]